MVDDAQWRSWLSRSRSHPLPVDLTDRVMARIEPSEPCKPLERSRFIERLGQVLLWTAATVLCIVRLYSTVGLLLPEFAFAEKAKLNPQGNSHAQHIASRL